MQFVKQNTKGNIWIFNRPSQENIIFCLSLNKPYWYIWLKHFSDFFFYNGSANSLPKAFSIEFCVCSSLINFFYLPFLPKVWHPPQSPSAWITVFLIQNKCSFRFLALVPLSPTIWSSSKHWARRQKQACDKYKKTCAWAHFLNASSLSNSLSNFIWQSRNC